MCTSPSALGTRRRPARAHRAHFRARRVWHARRILAAGMSVVPEPRPLDTTLGYHGAVCDFKRRLIEAMLHETRGNRTHAARALGLQRTYLLRLIRELGVAAPPAQRRPGAKAERTAPVCPPERDNGSPSLPDSRETQPPAPQPAASSGEARAPYPPRRPPARAAGDNGRRPLPRVGGSSNRN